MSLGNWEFMCHHVKVSVFLSWCPLIQLCGHERWRTWGFITFASAHKPKENNPQFYILCSPALNLHISGCFIRIPYIIDALCWWQGSALDNFSAPLCLIYDLITGHYLSGSSQTLTFRICWSPGHFTHSHGEMVVVYVHMFWEKKHTMTLLEWHCWWR